MKLVKMLSLVAVAAVVAMALVGVSSASAESNSPLLCENAELVCEEPWPNPTTIVAHATSPRFLTSIGTIECEKSLVELTLLNTVGTKSILAHILSLSLEGNCHLGSTKCAVTVSEVGGISFTHGPNPLEWKGVAVPLPLGETSMNTSTNVKCGFLINCTYELGEETEATIANNAEGVVTMAAEEAELKRSKGFCPEVSTWDATYEWTGTDLWLESSGAWGDLDTVVLCESAELVCEEPWPNPTTIVAHATSPRFLTSIGTIECEKSLVELTLLNTVGKSILAHVLSLKFEGNCHLGGTSCAITVSEVGGISFEHGPYKLEWIGKVVPLPLGTSSMNTIVNVKCGILINCTYTLGEETETTITDNAEGIATMVASEAELHRVQGFCPESSRWDAAYEWSGVGLWLETSTTSPEPSSVLLCKSKELECQKPWPSPVTTVGHSTSPKFLTNSGAIECERSLTETTLLHAELKKLQLAHILSLNFEGNCHLGKTTCIIAVEELGGISITHGVNLLEWIGKAVSLSLGETSMNTVINVKCSGIFLLSNCTYELGEEAETKIINDAEGVATMIAEKAQLKLSKGFCLPSLTWDATYVGLGTGLWLES